MRSRLHRFLTSGVLSVWGGVLLAFYFSGRIRAYLHPNFQPFVLVAGAVLLCLAFLVLISPATSGAHGSRSSVGSVLASLLLTVPLLLAVTNTLDRFAADTVANRVYVQDLSQLPGSQPPPGFVEPALPDDGSSSRDDTRETNQYLLPKNKQGRIEAQVIDFLYAAQLPDLRDQLDGKPVEVIGQLMPAKTNNPDGKRFVVIRMIMACCAADAQPVALPVEPESKPGLPGMTWVKVTGTAAFPIEGGRNTPVVQNAVLEQIDPPEDLYLY